MVGNLGENLQQVYRTVAAVYEDEHCISLPWLLAWLCQVLPGCEAHPLPRFDVVHSSLVVEVQVEAYIILFLRMRHTYFEPGK